MKVRTRLYGIDLFRVISAFIIFVFHVHIHIGVSFGLANNFVGLGHIFMIAFFMLSGFSIFYTSNINQKKSSNLAGGGVFLLKRIISIYPLYFVVHVLYLLKTFLTNNHIGGMKNLIITPVELSLLQSVYDGSFSVLHNGGTWFISCIFICYLLYPYVASVINLNTNKQNFVLFVLLYLISSYSVLPVYFFNFSSIYSNVFFRFIEFMMGVIVAKLTIDYSQNLSSKIVVRFISIFFVYFLLFISISLGVKLGFNSLGIYNFIAIPCFAHILYQSVCSERIFKNKVVNKIILVLSENTYAFFLAQFFVWDIIRFLDKNTILFTQNRNIKLFLVSFLLCCAITAVLHYFFEKPLKKLFRKALFRDEFSSKNLR